MRRYPISLSDQQLRLVMDAAKCMTPDQRHSFLLRIGPKLKLLAALTAIPQTNLSAR